MLELVEPHNLPDFLGGTCTCEGLGGCMKSKVGPWDDFQLVDPWGIRNKTTGQFFNFEKPMETPAIHHDALNDVL